MKRKPSPGFAMIDVLVALLLLAVALTGACMTLLQTMRATHGGLLATRAVDLAADLAEELRAAGTTADVQARFEAWRGNIPAVLPTAALAPEEFASIVRVEATEPGYPHVHVLRLRWTGKATGEVQELQLPIVADSWVEAP